MRRAGGRAIVAAAIAFMAVTPAAARAQGEPFRDPSLPLRQRVDDLMRRLTPDEKIGLLHQYQQPIPRLGIGVFKAGTEALHGVAWSNDDANNGTVVTANATAYPQALGLASTWDPRLIRRIGSAVGDEARGLHAQNPTVWGLNLWAPVVNLLRDPRWGRNEEGYSEDPALTSAIAIAYGSGIEGGDPRHLKAAPTLKHFLAYNNEVRRDTTSSQLSPRVLHEYDLQAFEPALRAGAATGVMASYNLVNGRPMTVDPMLNEIRAWSPFPLFNVSDAFAPYNLTGSQHYFATQPEADAAMFKAGVDSFTADDNKPAKMIADVKAALAQGLMTEQDVERADRHALQLRFRLGEFDPGGGPYGSIGPEAVNAPAHQRLARRAAAEAAVLLKNDARALPLKANGRIAVVGPLADTNYTDWYGGKPPYQVTPRQGIAERADVVSSEGADRIALKAENGRYVTATDGPVTATADSADEGAQFDVFGWGQGIVTLRNVRTSHVLGYEGGAFITRDAQPSGWFVPQQFKLEAQPDGSYALRYAGYDSLESWFGDKVYATVGEGGKLTLGASEPEDAAHFEKTTLRDGQQEAVEAARGADAAVVVVGSMPFINGREAHDRTTMALAESQEALVQAVQAANPHTVVVVENSYPDTLTWEQEHVPAILWTTHAGQETGHALADVLFGDVNPAGRLTQTWYRSESDLPDILDYDVIGSDRTYQYFKGRPLYAFGHGLSYTRFRYGAVRLGRGAAGRGDVVRARVRVTNAGGRAGDEVVQLYTHQRSSRVKQPLKTLRAFARVHLRPGESRDVRLRFRARDLATWDVTRDRWALEPGRYDVMAGGASDELPARTTLRVRGRRLRLSP
jgi:beta-glucosidase